MDAILSDSRRFKNLASRVSWAPQQWTWASLARSGGLRLRHTVWLAVALVLICWGLGLPFSPSQRRIVFPYSWEVLALGCLFVLIPTWMLLTDLRRTRRSLKKANGALRHKVRQRTRELQQQTTLLKVSRALSATLQLEPILEQLTLQVREVMQADACSILLIERGVMRQRAVCGLDPAISGTVLSLNRALASASKQLTRPQIVRDGDHDFPMALRDNGMRTVVSRPLSNRGKVMGQVSIYYRDSAIQPEEQFGLLESLSGQAAVAIENAGLYEEKEHVSSLLRGALAPKDQLAFPGIDVGHRYLPSMELSGDYYDLIPLGPDRVGLVIADVGGKGADAAIQAVRAKHIIHSYTIAGLSPARCLQLLNQQILDGEEDVRMVTVFLAIADLAGGWLDYACAGHDRPIIWLTGMKHPVFLKTGGIVAGVLPEATYEQGSIHLPPGSLMVMYTDGVTEARSPGRELFGLNRLIGLVEKEPNCPPQRLVDRIYMEAHGFANGDLTDDMSILAVRFGEAVPSNSKDESRQPPAR